MTEQSKKIRSLSQRLKSKKQEPQWAKSQFQVMKPRCAAELLRFSTFFEQMLVLKSEDLFGHQAKTLKRVVAFLALPDWEPRAWRALDKSGYAPMDLSARRRLKDSFEPHNQRLYEYLGVDFGWQLLS